MVAATHSRQRTDGERWQAALERAIAEALDVLIEPISGEAFVESATRPGILYAVSATSCTCPAGLKGQICKHVACYRAQLGLLPFAPEPEPATALEPHRCPSCTAGRVEEWTAGHISGFRLCDVCGGTGQLPARRLDEVTWDDAPAYRALSPEEQRATGHARRQPVAAA